MTINRKISLTLGLIVIVVAAGTAIAQHAQLRQYSYTAPITTPATTIAATSTSPKVTPPKTTPTPPVKAPDTYTLADVAMHNTGTSCWSTINGGVYDLTSWINQHPGGPEAILSICGKDGSAAFNDQHGGQRRPANELAGFQIGTLVQ